MQVKLALCQMKVSDDKDANIAKAQRYIKVRTPSARLLCIKQQ